MTTHKLKWFFTLRDVRGAEGELASATKDGVVLRKDLDQEVWNPANDTSGYKLVEPDDFVIGLRSFQHGISHSSVRGLVSPAYTVLRAVEGQHPPYWKHFFRTRLAISWLENATQGIRQGRSVNPSLFLENRMQIPSVEQQMSIAAVLNGRVAVLESLARDLNLLRHYQDESREHFFVSESSAREPEPARSAAVR